LGELHALAAEYRLVLAAEHGLYPPACTQLDEADLSQHLAGHGLGRTGVPVWFWARGDDGICAPLAHVPRSLAARAKECGEPGDDAGSRVHGTSTASKIRATRSSAVISSASAS